MNNKKVIGVSIAVVIILVVAIIATSYAVFTANLTGVKENKLTTGYITLSCNETTFSVSNTQPMTDENGIAAGDNVATCTLKSEMVGEMNVGYDVALYDIDTLTPDDSLGQENVKIQATKSIDSATATYLAGSSATAGVLVGDLSSSAGLYDTSITGYKLDSDIVSGNHDILYSIKAWVSSTGDATDSDLTDTSKDGVCSDDAYTTEEACTGANEIWGYSQTHSQAGGSFSFKLKIGATQVLSD